MNLAILAGGMGTRLGLKDIPKPMVRIASKPILEHQILLAKRFGITDIYILSNYLAQCIIDYFADGSSLGVNIVHITEKEPRGTAGAVKLLEKIVNERFLVFYGDVMLDFDLESFITFDKQFTSIASIVVHPNDHPNDSDLLEVNDNNLVITFHPKPHQKNVYYRNLVNAAVYILSPKIFQYIPDDKPSDFGRDIFPKLVNKGELIYAYNTTEYIKDVGTIDRLTKVEEDLLSGKIFRLNKKNKQVAIFLDRDGVLNFEVDSLNSLEQFNLLPEVPEAIGKINKSDYLAVVITNQPVIAKGFITENKLDQIHNKLDYLLGLNYAYLDRLYYCPHHPEIGFEGERSEYKIDCNCRKPKIGMIEKAVAELNIDIDKSFLIGDRTVDIKTGINAGLKSILVRTGYGGEDRKYNCEPDFIFENLNEAVSFILTSYDKLRDLSHHLITSILDFKKSKKKSCVILIGGLSRSGKSVFVKILCQSLKDHGIPVKTINLDNWLISVNKRESWMTVRDRYIYKDIMNDFSRLFKGEVIQVKQYNVKSRIVTSNNIFYSLDVGDFLIIDGIVSLDIEFLRNRADYKIYVDSPETIRKKRFYNFYKYKGLSIEEIENLYLERLYDEIPVVKNTIKYADYILKTESYL